MAPLYIFTHIPKTAGSTMSKFLRGQFTRAEILDIAPIPRAEQASRMAALPESVHLVIGHARYGLHAHTTRPCRYFTILREPVARAISAYGYIQRTPEHRFHARIVSGEMDLAALAREHTDLQTKYIAGTPPDTEVDAAELARAKEHLISKFAVFGLMERFDESMLLLAKTFGWPCRPFISKNVTPVGSSRPVFSEEALAAVREATRHDRELYQFAAEQFQTRLEAQPAGYASELRRFKRQLRLLEWRHAMGARVRAIFGKSATF